MIDLNWKLAVESPVMYWSVSTGQCGRANWQVTRWSSTVGSLLMPVFPAKVAWKDFQSLLPIRGNVYRLQTHTRLDSPCTFIPCPSSHLFLADGEQKLARLRSIQLTLNGISWPVHFKRETQLHWNIFKWQSERKRVRWTSTENRPFETSFKLQRKGKMSSTRLNSHSNRRFFNTERTERWTDEKR